MSPVALAFLLGTAGLLFAAGATFAEMGPTDEVDEISGWVAQAAILAGLFAGAAGAFLTLAILEVAR